MADSAPVLPQFLIDKVLVRLPAKSAGRFRCVSKLWRSHLSSPKFMKSHRDLNINSGARNIIVPIFDRSPCLLTFAADGRDGTSNRVNPPLFSKPIQRSQGIKILNTCHGFALILQNACMFVFNPVTLELLEIPRFSEEPDECLAEYGLGYDSSDDDYKVVRLSCFDRTYVDVYSLKMKSSWRRTSNSPSHYDCPKHVACSNGRFHWMALNDDIEHVLVAFNLAREEYEEVPLPANCKPLFSLAAFGEILALERYSSLENCFEIWVMKEYGVQESWTKVAIDLKKFVCLSVSGEDEIVCRHVHARPGKFAAYSLSTGVWRDFFVEGVPRGAFEYTYDYEMAMTFMECLLSPRYLSE